MKTKTASASAALRRDPSASAALRRDPSASAALRRDPPAVVPNPTPVVTNGFTLGLDPGDRQHHVCVLEAAGNIVREAALPNTRPALAQLLAEFPRSTAALAKTQNLWRRQTKLKLLRDGRTALAGKLDAPGFVRP